MRFRSVAFSKPVVALPDDEGGDDAGKRARREKARAAAWRQAQDTDDSKGSRRGGDEVADRSKSFLDAKGKRKVAFIKKDVSTSASGASAAGGAAFRRQRLGTPAAAAGRRTAPALRSLPSLAITARCAR